MNIPYQPADEENEVWRGFSPEKTVFALVNRAYTAFPQKRKRRNPA